MEWHPSTAEAKASFLDDLLISGHPATTRRTYASILQRVTADDLAALTPPYCRALVATAVQTRSMATAASVWAVLRSFCGYCTDRGWFPVSPMREIPRPKVPERHQPYLRPAQLRAVWRAANTDDTRLVLLFLMAGLRAAEMLAVRWADLDLDAGVCRVIGKGRRPRECVLNAEMVRLLRTRRQGDRVFPFTYDSLRERIARLGKRGGVARLTCHMFRRSWAVAWMLETGDWETLRTLGGWGPKSDMPRMYARAAVQESAIRKARAVDLSARLLEPPHEGTARNLSE